MNIKEDLERIDKKIDKLLSQKVDLQRLCMHEFITTEITEVGIYPNELKYHYNVKCKRCGLTTELKEKIDEIIR